MHQEVQKIVKFFWMNGNSNYELPISEKWFSVLGKTESINIDSNTPTKMKTYDDLSFRISEEGISVLVIYFLDKNISLDFDVRVIPIDLGLGKKIYTTDDIIQEYGLPDERVPYAFSWPERKLFDGIWYSPKAGTPVFGEHWRYLKYPDLVFDIIPTNGYIRAMTTYRDKNFYIKSKRQ